MHVTINPGRVNGTVSVPPSKSMTQRAYAMALLHHGTTTIYNPGRSEDELAAFEVIKQLGAQAIEKDNGVIITSQGIKPISHLINCGESGLAARLLIPLLATAHESFELTGRGTLLGRPMEGVEQALAAMGVECPGFNGFLPLKIMGPIKNHQIRFDASGGSQLLSGILIACAFTAKTRSIIEVKRLKSKPYIDLTLQVLARAGRPVTNENYSRFIIEPVHDKPIGNIELNIEGDWSGAANILVAGAIAGNVTLQNLEANSTQADKKILQILRNCGAKITETGTTINVQSSQLTAFECDATHSPDLFPILAILAACCNGDSSIRGLHRLFHKESNRAESIGEMLLSFNVPFSMEDDTLFVTGVPYLQGTVIDSYHDHRIAMAAAIGALRATSRGDITGADAINKSYPAFYEDLKSIGIETTRN